MSSEKRACKECGEEKSLSEFTVQAKGTTREHVRVKCKSCVNDAARLAYQASPEKGRRRAKDFAEKNRALVRQRSSAHYNSNPGRQHGLRGTDYFDLLEIQDGTCAICKRLETRIHPATKRVARYCVDHDHAHCPGKSGCPSCIRGLLCWNCNRQLGLSETEAGFIMTEQREYLDNPPASIWRERKAAG